MKPTEEPAGTDGHPAQRLILAGESFRYSDILHQVAGDEYTDFTGLHRCIVDPLHQYQVLGRAMDVGKRAARNCRIFGGRIRGRLRRAVDGIVDTEVSHFAR
eukprot:s2980_g5.t1